MCFRTQARYFFLQLLQKKLIHHNLSLQRPHHLLSIPLTLQEAPSLPSHSLLLSSYLPLFRCPVCFGLSFCLYVFISAVSSVSLGILLLTGLLRRSCIRLFHSSSTSSLWKTAEQTTSAMIWCMRFLFSSLKMIFLFCFFLMLYILSHVFLDYSLFSLFSHYFASTPVVSIPANYHVCSGTMHRLFSESLPLTTPKK